MSKEIDNLVSIYMAGGNVSCILNKMIQEGIDPATLTEAVQALDKARAIREGQKSITDGDALAIKTYGTIEQMKANFTKKWMEGEFDNIASMGGIERVDAITKLHKADPNANSGVKNNNKQTLNPMIAKRLSEKSHQAS